jgi:hypothetical protein
VQNSALASVLSEIRAHKLCYSASSSGHSDKGGKEPRHRHPRNSTIYTLLPAVRSGLPAIAWRNRTDFDFYLSTHPTNQPLGHISLNTFDHYQIAARIKLYAHVVSNSCIAAFLVEL